MKARKIYVLIIITALLAMSFLYMSNQVATSFKFIKESTQTSFKDGDIIFQTSESAQCEAVRIATNSKFSHCGIIFIENDKTYVYEAVQPVKMTLLSEWIQHGKDLKYAVKRLKNADKQLTKEVLQKMKLVGKTMDKKDYDLYFEWSDEKIYCSELVWKIYKEGANIELCVTKKLKEFNLNHPAVQQIMKQRYGTAIPYDENVVAPSQLYDSELVKTIFDNY